MRAWMHAADLARTKTLQGGLVARSAPGLPFLLREGMEVAFVPPQHDAPRRGIVKNVRDEGKGAYLVTFEGVDDIGTAELLAGCGCLVRREDVPEAVSPEEGAGLAGWEVRDVRAGLVGTVRDVLENPGQTLLEVSALPRAGSDGGARTVLIPLVDAFVAGIDEEARRIDVDVPDGLLDL